jgi:hypothetical protein
MFEGLVRYKEENGDCNVPQRWSENPQLATWVGGQRSRCDKLSTAQKAKLDEIGFDWNPQDSTWEAMIAELKRYKDEHGDCNVPDKWSKNRKLGSWVGTQRSFSKKGRLSPERKARLDALGFIWDLRPTKHTA